MTTKPDLHVPVAAAQGIIDRVLPDRTVARVSPIHGGEIATILEIAFSGSHPSLVMKVYPDSLHWKMQKEVAVSSLVQGRLSAAVPHIVHADDSKRLFHLNFVLMTKLDGSTLQKLGPTLAPAERASAYRQVGRLLREFHAISMEAFGYIGPQGIWTRHETNHAYMSFQFAKKSKELVDRGGDAALARRVEAYVERRGHLLADCRRPVLCHNDLHAGNVLSEKQGSELRILGVLDFEGALAGDPLMDVAKSLYYLTEEERCALLDGYGEIERPQWSQALDLYHLYFVLELWCWKAQIGDEEALEGLAFDLERLTTT
jgi:aminoglycoside phosphotransferase (APT) family kinase protein